MKLLAPCATTAVVVFALSFTARSQVAAPDVRRQAWESWRADKARRDQSTRTQFGAASNSVTNPLTQLSLRSYADSFGDFHAIGEFRNDTSSTLSFAKIYIALKNSGGGTLETVFTYFYGSQTGRLALSGSFISVLPPGGVGFFDVYSDTPFSSVTSYAVTTSAETYDLASVYASVTVPGQITIGSGSSPRYSGTAVNSSGGAQTFFTKVYVAGYSGGQINDVDFTYVDGSSITCNTITTDTAIAPGASAAFFSFFLRPVTSIGLVATEWDEVAINPTAASVSSAGGTETVAVFNNCSWSSSSDSAWLTITSGGSGTSDGVLRYAAASNSGITRTGHLTIAGLTFTLTQSGLPTEPTNPAATVFGSTAIRLTWSASSGAASYNAKRSTISAAEVPIASGVTSTAYVDSGLLSGQRYYYVVTAVNGSGESANSSEVFATPAPASFTDPTLGVSLTAIKAVHVTELRQYVDTLRSRYGLSAVAWTDSTPTSGATTIKVVHLSELRDALSAAYVQAGRSAPTFSDPTPLTGTTTVKAAHITELREAILAIY